MRFLIIRFSSFGDILLTTPLIRCLRRKYPDSVIDFAVKDRYKDVILSNPYLNNIVILPEGNDNKYLRDISRRVKENRYDYIIDVHGNYRSRYVSTFSGSKALRWSKPRIRKWLLTKLKLNRLSNWPEMPLRYLKAAESLGVEDDGGGLEFHLSAKMTESAEELSASLDIFGKRLLAIAPGANWITKQWEQEKYSETVKILLLSEFEGVLAFGSAGERVLCGEICSEIGVKAHNLAGETDIGTAAVMLGKCGLYIGNDSGLSHLASAVQIPSVVIFGPTVREFGFFPFRNRSAVVERDLYCRPCTHIGNNRCPKKHFRCMREISVENVLEKISSIL